MGISFSGSFFWQLVLVVLSFLIAGPAAAGKIVIGGTAYWNPYCYVKKDEPGVLKGFSVDVVRLILTENGDDPVFMVLPWKRCLRMLESDQVDLVLDGSINSDRLRIFNFSNQMYKVDNVFFYSTTNLPQGPDIKSVNEVNNYSMGALAGFNLAILPFDSSKVQSTALDYKALLGMLKHNRFDLAIGLRQILLSHAKMNNLNMANVDSVSIPGTSPLSFHVLAAKTPHGRNLIRKINSGLEKLKQDGRFSELMEKYGIVDSQ